MSQAPTLAASGEFLKANEERARFLMSIPTDEKLQRLTEYGYFLRENPPSDFREAPMYPLIFNGDYFREHLDAWFGNRRILDDYIQTGPGEYVRRYPYNGVLIIGAGNSMMPLILDVILATLTNNPAIVRPSRSLYDEFMRLYNSLAKVPSDFITQSILPINIDPNSDEFQELITSSPLQRIKFTGGGKAYDKLRELAAKNPHRPEILVAGPLTGCAIIDQESASENTVNGFAQDIVFGHQTLCSSPTIMYWVGNQQSLMEFLNALHKRVEYLSNFEISEGGSMARMAMELKLRRGGVDFVSTPHFISVINAQPNLITPLYERRPYYLDVRTAESVQQAVESIIKLPQELPYKDVWRIGTIGYALKDPTELSAPVYRIRPIGDMNTRSPYEPLGGDDTPLVYFLTQVSYKRQ